NIFKKADEDANKPELKSLEVSHLNTINTMNTYQYQLIKRLNPSSSDKYRSIISQKSNYELFSPDSIG
ncbi:27099_t:CDS:1, partial [Dentiscutata erythropus]